MSEATAFAPASIGNVAVGFDVLGLAVAGAGDTVTARRSAEPGVRIATLLDPSGKPHDGLSKDPGQNTASIAAASLWSQAGESGGVELDVAKGVPLQSGMGSSAASAVAAVAAVNALLGDPLPVRELLEHALEGESFASGGRHADNVAPSLLGGLVLCPPGLGTRVAPIRAPAGISSVLLHPALTTNTAESRRGLAASVSREQWVSQQGFLAAFVAACEQEDVELLKLAFRDVIIEPQRKGGVACFDAVQAAALAAGAFGCSLSGSGPSLFALCESGAADSVADAMRAACEAAGIDCRTWVSPMNAPGVRVEPGQP